MRLGASYNLFDGTELLEAGIRMIREHTDHVSVVYQTISNYSRKSEINLESFLAPLRAIGLVNELYHYQPDLSLAPSENEVIKRNIGLCLSRAAGCTHHIAMDVDEFYLPGEFSLAKNDIFSGNYSISAAQMVSYYKFPDTRLDPPEEYFVPFICKLDTLSEYVHNAIWPVLVDPARRQMNLETAFRKFHRHEIQMHHMSYVRKNIREKLENSSACFNFMQDIDRIVEHHDRFTSGRALIAGSPSWYSGTKKTEESREFNINI